MKRASYKQAVVWLADNDDCDWLDDFDAGQPGASPSVSTYLVADLFGVEVDKVTEDLRRHRQRVGLAGHLRMNADLRMNAGGKV